MSRSSKGFADFFPTAPSVLQQKRSKAAQNRRRPKPETASDPNLTHVPIAPRAPFDGESEGDIINGVRNGEVHVDPAATAQEDHDCVQGDLLNEVASASSTSTSSSIFSTGHRALGMVHPHDHHHSTSLTPLTNLDSSPPANNQNSPKRKRNHEMAGAAGNSKRSPLHEPLRTASRTRTPDYTPLQKRCQVRPGKGEIKGAKIKYDPDQDKKLTSKERKSRTAEYITFGKEVCLRSI
jgi:histone-lysine N-methyltransferase SETD1